jgi:hypothetical protein
MSSTSSVFKALRTAAIMLDDNGLAVNTGVFHRSPGRPYGRVTAGVRQKVAAGLRLM